MASLKSLGEQVSRIYARFVDRENIKPVLDNREVQQLLIHAINKVLATKVDEQLSQGYSDAPLGMIATYEDQDVITAGGVSTVILPAEPIAVGNDSGIVEVFEDEMNPYIPIPRQFAKIMQGTDLAFLEQNVGYFRSTNGELRFTRDIGTLDTVSTVTIRLLIHDISTYAPSTQLPLPSNYHWDVITMVLQQLGLGQVALQELNVQENAE